MTKANEETARKERMGFFDGERAEEVERALEKVLGVIRKERLSIAQAEHLEQRLKSEIKKEESLTLSNTEFLGREIKEEPPTAATEGGEETKIKGITIELRSEKIGCQYTR